MSVNNEVHIDATLKSWRQQRGGKPILDLPFTPDQFVRTFIDYNRSIWPIQPLAWILGVVTVWIAYIDRAWSSRFVLAALALT